MDTMSINDLVFECIRALVLVVLLIILFLRGKFTSLARHRGWKLIVAGFCLITLATLIDITDEIPGMERFVILGDTIYEALIEKLPGYLLGFVLVLIGFYRMIPSLQKADVVEQALQESESRFRLIFEASPDPAILARLEDGVILDVNPAFKNQTGYLREETLGRNSLDINLWWEPARRKEFRHLLQEQQAINNLEFDFRIKNGDKRPGLLSSRLLNIDGQDCSLTVVRDITMIKEAEEALLETDRIRSEFVSTAAHELRTPLSVLLGYSELLTLPESRGQFNDRERQVFLAEIAQKSLQLSHIVDDLLDVSRMTAGVAFKMKMAPLNLNQVLQKEFESLRLQNLERKFKLDLKAAETTQVNCDGQRIQQVLDNLLSNAVKYSAPGGEIILASRNVGDNFEFSVRDNGIGMTAEQSGRVFEKFYRADSSNTATSGFGLGLSIVRQIVETHHGKVAIESDPASGTLVAVTLPCNPAA